MHQHGLRLIVGVVPHRHGLRAGGQRNLRQETIARLPGRFLQGKTGGGGHRAHIGLAGSARQAERLSELSHKQRVVASGLAAQAMIEMRDMQTQAQLRRQSVKQMEQAQRIRPARHPDHHRLAGPKQLVSLRVSPHLA